MAGSIATLALMAVLAGGPPGAPDAAVRVRADSPTVRALIDGAVLRSATIRDLVTRLACTDAIVYVEITSSPQVPTARTKLVASVAGARFIRIGINAAIADIDRMALLAHELQHALEIAEQAAVRDDEGMRRLFRKIGYWRGGDSFETEEARRVEWTVRRELRTKMGG